MLEKPTSINYIKLLPYFGGYGGMSFAYIGKEDTLYAYVYPGTYSFEATPAENKTAMEFPFTEEGYEEAIAWVKQQYLDHEENWKQYIRRFV